MRPTNIIVLPPGLDICPGIFDGQEPVSVRAIVPEAAVKDADTDQYERLREVFSVKLKAGWSN